MELDFTALFVAIMISLIGMGYMMFGKKLQRRIASLCGLMMCIFPYFITNFYGMVLVCVLLMAIPYFLPY